MDEAIHRGKKDGANFCIYGGTENGYSSRPETNIYILPVNTSQYNQIFVNEVLSKINTSEDANRLLILDSDKKRIIFSPDYYTDHTISFGSLDYSVRENVSRCIYAICALAYYAESNYTSAISLFEKITNYENNSNILFYIGNSYSFQNKFDEAIKAYAKAIKINPQSPMAWNNKGLALANLHKSDEAIKAYDKAIEINPQDSMALENKMKLSK